MSDSQPRSCWSILAIKAQTELDTCRAQCINFQQQVDQLLASHARIQQMIADYQTHHSALSRATHRMRDGLNMRQFLSQLNTLSSRIASDQITASNQLLDARGRMQEAEQELLKLQMLIENDLKAYQHRLNALEQRQNDEVAISQFRLRGG